MANYKMLGGGIITANTPEEFVQKLRALSFNPCDTIEEFIETTAKNCLLQTGKFVQAGPADEFLSELIANGFVEMLPEPQYTERDIEEHTFEDGRVEVRDYTDNPSGDIIKTYQASIPEIKTWQDVIDEQKPSEVAHNFVGL